MNTQAIEERFWNRVVWNGDEDECWEWNAAQDGYGYGLAWDGKRVVRSHRLCYGLLIGPIPEGHQLHHECENPRCCNPWHLRPVTPHQHKTIHGQSGAAGENAVKTHCKYGHHLSGGNLYVTPEGRRKCRECHVRRQHEYLSRKKEVV